MEISIFELTPIPHPKDGNVLGLHYNIVSLSLFLLKWIKKKQLKDMGPDPHPPYGKYQLAFFKPFPWGIEDFECTFEVQGVFNECYKNIL